MALPFVFIRFAKGSRLIGWHEAREFLKKENQPFCELVDTLSFFSLDPTRWFHRRRVRVLRDF